MEIETSAYRDGSSPEDNKTLMPGILRFPHLILKRTLLKADNEFYGWIKTAQFNAVEHRDLTLSLLDENNSPVVAWHFLSAFPIKLTYSPLEADGSGPMMEILEIAYSNMEVRNE